MENESGRSMVEMLGVLAVMGVLSIGGVSGIKYAVVKIKANDIANSISSANMMTQAGQGALFINVPGITFQSRSVPGVGDHAFFSVDIGNDKDLCKQLRLLYKNNKNFAFVGDCSD